MDSPDTAPLQVAHVLLPLDGSALAAAALPTALAMVGRFGGRLVTIGVAADDRRVGRLRDEIEAAVGDVPDVEVVVGVGDDPAAMIIEHANALSSSVICMSTRGRGRVAGAVIGSVARAVFQRSSMAIVAVGPQADRPPALVGKDRRRPAGFPEPLSVGGVIACVDGSSASEAVLPEAARWAVALGHELTILTVAEDAAAGSDGKRPNRFGPADPEAYVQRVAAEWTDAAQKVTAVVAVDPISVSSGLRAHLAAHPAALVALTAHARTGFDRVGAGATAADIVRTSTAPSLVVPLPSEAIPQNGGPSVR
jgi:nucleotide-binding universal stress UspA family protein